MRATTKLHRKLIGGAGERLALVREAFAETQATLAAALQVDPGTISSMETERTVMSLAALVFIARHYHVNAGWLINGIGDIFDPSRGVLYLGDERIARHCRAAVKLMQLFPKPSTFCQIERHDFGPQYGWVFQLDPDRAVVILPGEEKPGPMLKTVGTFIVQRHRFVGRMKLSEEEYDKLCGREADVSEVVGLLQRPPDVIEFKDYPDWIEHFPPDQQPVIEQALEELQQQTAQPRSVAGKATAETVGGPAALDTNVLFKIALEDPEFAAIVNELRDSDPETRTLILELLVARRKIRQITDALRKSPPLPKEGGPTSSRGSGTS